MTVTARRAYDIWVAVLQEERLFEAVLAGTHRGSAAAKELGYSDEDMTVLDELHSQPGLRWNVENSHYRAATHIAGKLQLGMQRTLFLLTKADEDWIQELCFVYLSHQHWRELGHDQITECERFAAYTRSHILQRRVPPPHIEEVLEFELALLRHQRAIAALSPADWEPRAAPAAGPDRDAATLGLPPSAALIDVPIDISDWIKSADPRVGTVRPGAISIVAQVASPLAPVRLKQLTADQRAVLGRFDGTTPTRAIADALADEYERDDLDALIDRWARDGLLVMRG